MQKDIPILFSTEMVQAILEGRKTQTRRIVKHHLDDRGVRTTNVPFEDWHGKEVKCPYGSPGDLLWVRETFKRREPRGEFGPYAYKADMKHTEITPMKWMPCIHMPKEAARIWLQVEEIRVARLQDITVYDAADEGVEYWNIDAEAFKGGELVADYKNYTWRDDPAYPDFHFPTFSNAIDSFRTLWQSINGQNSWSANPWVWVVKYQVLSIKGKPDVLPGPTPEKNEHQ